jgi:hypothetical protein
MTPESVIAAITFLEPPHLGHLLKSMANTGALAPSRNVWISVSMSSPVSQPLPRSIIARSGQ